MRDKEGGQVKTSETAVRVRQRKIQHRRTRESKDWKKKEQKEEGGQEEERGKHWQRLERVEEIGRTRYKDEGQGWERGRKNDSNIKEEKGTESQF